MDQETDTGNYREHGQRQAVQHQIKTDVEVTYRHPRPQRLAERLFTIGEKVHPDKRRHQRRQTNSSHADSRGEIFRPASTRERQQDEANQWQNNG
ncbi:Uncharacterised protein [Salmonella enterica subsp. arizonae]|nr:Uncharacterised protein [Salmonella enterica subsp. arizonae]